MIFNHKLFYLIIQCAVLIGLYGCNSVPTSTVTANTDSEVDKPIDNPINIGVDMTPTIDINLPSINTTINKPPIKKAQAATQTLLEQAESLYLQHNYDSAIAVAERLIRINRTSAEGYIILAKSHIANGALALGKQFARQGLLFSKQREQKKRLNLLLHQAP